MDKFEELKLKIDEAKTKSLVMGEMKAFVELMLSMVNKSKKEIADLSQENIKVIKQGIAQLEAFHEKQTKLLDDKTNVATGQFATDLASLKALIAKVKTIKPRDGIDGISPTPEEIVPLVLAQIKIPEIKDVILDGRQEIVEKINTGGKKDLKIQLEQIESGKLKTDISNWALGVLDQRTQFLINKTTASSYSLPTASASTLGGVKIGARLTMTGDTLSADVQSGGTVGPGTINEIAYFDTTTSIASLAVATYPSLTELSYVKGVTSAIQTQLNAKGAGTVTSVSGTANRITSTGGTTPVIDISASYVGQSSITTLGTIATGVWNGTLIAGTYGGTGVNNGAKTLTYLKNISFTSADDTGVYTLPTGIKTLLATDGAGTSLTGIPYTLTGTANQVVLSAGTGNITFSLPQSIATSSNPQFATIELGAASDTTLARVSAGVISVEGVTIPSISSTNTITNKRVSKRVVVTTQSATPTINTDNGDVFQITGLAQAITSFTTNLSGTPSAGDLMEIQVTDDGTARALTFGASFAATPSTPLPTTTVISTMLRMMFQRNNANTIWDCVATTQAGSLAVGSITGLGTGVATALAVNVGSAGAFVTFNGALGTPSSGTLTNCTGLPIAGLTASTSTALGVGSIELGHATDTSITRVSAGLVAIEGVRITTSAPLVISAASYTTDTGTSLNVDSCDMFIITAQAGALLFNNPSGTPAQGQELIIRIKDNATARALTYGSQFRASSDLALPTTTVLSKTLYMKFKYNSTDTKWDLLAFLNNF